MDGKSRLNIQEQCTLGPAPVVSLSDSADQVEDLATYLYRCLGSAPESDAAASFGPVG